MVAIVVSKRPFYALEPHEIAPRPSSNANANQFALDL